ncbi:hypothetical protein [Kutzneria sp. NPDC051319]|uniref:hypothetical protein n=1 Tax=Kutzneria sp. NPDC051319 TaxID=3155047 RepID=UPI0034328BB5
MQAAQISLAVAVTAVAERLAAVLGGHSVPERGDFPLGAVLRGLAQEQSALAASVVDYPLALAVDTDGHVDELARPLATLAGTLATVLVAYHGLDDVPGLLRSQLRLDLRELHAAAVSVLAVTGLRLPTRPTDAE